MKISKRQLRKLIRESIKGMGFYYDEKAHGPGAGATNSPQTHRPAPRSASNQDVTFDQFLKNVAYRAGVNVQHIDPVYVKEMYEAGETAENIANEISEIFADYSL